MADNKPKHELVSRKEALARGLKHYFTGKPCLRGHIAPLYTSGLRCIDCATEQRKQWRADNPQRSRELRMEWARKNPEKEKASQKKSHARPAAMEASNKNRREARERDPTPFRATRNRSFKKLYKEDPDRFRDQVLAWRAKNPEKYGNYILDSLARFC